MRRKDEASRELILETRVGEHEDAADVVPENWKKDEIRLQVCFPHYSCCYQEHACLESAL